MLPWKLLTDMIKKIYSKKGLSVINEHTGLQFTQLPLYMALLKTKTGLMFYVPQKIK